MEIQIGNSNRKLKLQIEIENRNWRVELKGEIEDECLMENLIENWDWEFELKIQWKIEIDPENLNWKLRSNWSLDYFRFGQIYFEMKLITEDELKVKIEV